MSSNNIKSLLNNASNIQVNSKSKQLGKSNNFENLVNNDKPKKKEDIFKNSDKAFARKANENKKEDINFKKQDKITNLKQVNKSEGPVKAPQKNDNSGKKNIEYDTEFNFEQKDSIELNNEINIINDIIYESAQNFLALDAQVNPLADNPLNEYSTHIYSEDMLAENQNDFLESESLDTSEEALQNKDKIDADRKLGAAALTENISDAKSTEEENIKINLDHALLIEGANRGNKQDAKDSLEIDLSDSSKNIITTFENASKTDNSEVKFASQQNNYINDQNVIEENDVPFNSISEYVDNIPPRKTAQEISIENDLNLTATNIEDNELDLSLNIAKQNIIPTTNLKQNQSNNLKDNALNATYLDNKSVEEPISFANEGEVLLDEANELIEQNVNIDNNSLDGLKYEVKFVNEKPKEINFNLATNEIINDEQDIDQNLIRQLEFSVKQIKQNNINEIKVNLFPKDLGEIRIVLELEVSKNGEEFIKNIKFSSERRATLEILEKNHTDLVKSLEQVESAKDSELHFNMHDFSDNNHSQDMNSKNSSLDQWNENIAKLNNETDAHNMINQDYITQDSGFTNGVSNEILKMYIMNLQV